MFSLKTFYDGIEIDAFESIYILNKLSLKYFTDHTVKWHRIFSVIIKFYIKTNQNQPKQNSYNII